MFALIAGAFDRPGEAFQTFHVIVFYSLTTLFRTAGALALLSLYPVPRWARVLTLVLTNTILAAQTYNGVLTAFLFSLAPSFSTSWWSSSVASALLRSFGSSSRSALPSARHH